MNGAISKLMLEGTGGMPCLRMVDPKKQYSQFALPLKQSQYTFENS